MMTEPTTDNRLPAVSRRVVPRHAANMRQLMDLYFRYMNGEAVRVPPELAHWWYDYQQSGYTIARFIADHSSEEPVSIFEEEEFQP